jgi:phosphatidylserine/phosphatidylglycerophosphate/cardiolipin synthase-like enzyme
MVGLNCLGIEIVVDREIRDKVTQLLAHQRVAPIRLRIVAPWISNANLSDDQTLVRKLQRLITYKYAKVTLIVADDWRKKKESEPILKDLAKIGVRIHYKKQLHAKMVIISNGQNGREKGLIISSANMTDTGMSSNREAGVFLLNEPELFERANTYFTDLLKYSTERETDNANLV